MNGIEITAFTSDTGPLTKKISLAPDGSLVSDGSACVMSRGTAKRLRLAGFADFARLIGGLKSNEAIALGALRSDLSDEVQVVTHKKLTELNGHAPSTVIARTAGHISYHPEKSAVVLLDYDTKGMPPDVKSRVDAAGGFWPSLLSVAPDLEHAERVHRASTSSGIVRSDTGEAIAGSSGVHVFLHVRDGADTERFLKALHDRCWLAGFGWMMVGGGGQLLERSIIDRMVFSGERLVFEGAPVLEAPLTQDAGQRAPSTSGTDMIDTVSVCRALTLVETDTLKNLKAKEKVRLGGAATKARTAFVKDHAARIVARTAGSPGKAQRTVEFICRGILLPDVELVFDAAEFTGATVADVLKDPSRFLGATMADPLEGIAYGRCKAKLMERPDLSLFVNSFAHGHAVYDLKYDAATVKAAIEAAPAADALHVLAEKQSKAELSDDEMQELKVLVRERSKVQLREITGVLKQATKEQAQERAGTERDQADAARTDRRVRLVVPHPDSEKTPVSLAIDEVFLAVSEPEPPMRGMDGMPVEVRERVPMMLHTLTSDSANQNEPAGMTRLPAPAMPLLSVHDEISYAYVIERHIEYVRQPRNGAPGGPVALPSSFIKSYMGYWDSALPCVQAVVTAPLVLPDGTLLAPNGLDRDRRMVFRIPPEMRAVLPKPHDPKPTPEQTRNALSFLTDEWLCDVATDFRGKCVLIALALTILERALLPERPAFFVTAGKRGGGKTTALAMIILAVTGRKPAAAAWSSSEDERRKALLAYLSEGVGSITFDNIPLGTVITCPTIEKILTAETYSDRVLGHTENRTVPALTVLTFTGNNIHAKGDLASRSLNARLDVERSDPENRPFKHSDPIAWTLDHRGKILRAMYVLLLGNPQLKDNKPPKTRFKLWWHLVGSSIEHAAMHLVTHRADLAKQQQQLAEGTQSKAADKGIAKLAPATTVDFVKLFAEVEVDDEETADLIDVLIALENQFSEEGKQSDTFQAKDIAELINNGTSKNSAALKAFFNPPSKTSPSSVTSKMIGYRIGLILDTPVDVRDEFLHHGVPALCTRTIKLKRSQPDNQAAQRHTATFRVEVVGEPIIEKIPEAKGADTKDSNAKGAEAPLGAEASLDEAKGAEASPSEAKDDTWESYYET